MDKLSRTNIEHRGIIELYELPEDPDLLELVENLTLANFNKHRQVTTVFCRPKIIKGFSAKADRGRVRMVRSQLYKDSYEMCYLGLNGVEVRLVAVGWMRKGYIGVESKTLEFL